MINIIFIIINTVHGYTLNNAKNEQLPPRNNQFYKQRNYKKQPASGTLTNILSNVYQIWQSQGKCPQLNNTYKQSRCKNLSINLILSDL